MPESRFTRSVMFVVAGLGVVAGFLQLDSSVTGNAVLGSSPFTPASVAGLLIIGCSALLAIYTARN